MGAPDALDRFDVVVVPFPYQDRLTTKRRPAIIVADVTRTGPHGLVWVLMVTSTGLPPWSSDVVIADVEPTGLKRDSRVRVAKVAVIETSRVLERIGRLSDHDAGAVEAELRRLLALRHP